MSEQINYDEIYGNINPFSTPGSIESIGAPGAPTPSTDYVGQPAQSLPGLPPDFPGFKSAEESAAYWKWNKEVLTPAYQKANEGKSFFVGMRDWAETMFSMGLNTMFPGAGLVANKLLGSEGSQEMYQQTAPLQTMAMIAGMVPEPTSLLDYSGSSLYPAAGSAGAFGAPSMGAFSPTAAGASLAGLGTSLPGASLLNYGVSDTALGATAQQATGALAGGTSAGASMGLPPGAVLSALGSPVGTGAGSIFAPSGPPDVGGFSPEIDPFAGMPVAPPVAPSSPFANMPTNVPDVMTVTGAAPTGVNIPAILGGAGAAAVLGGLVTGGGGAALPATTSGEVALPYPNPDAVAPFSNLGAGATGAAAGGALSTLAKWLDPVMSVASGALMLGNANDISDTAGDAIAGSSPWATGTGITNAGAALTAAINGDFANDPGFALAQRAAAATSSTQPGGYSAQAAANAALMYQNNRIQALSGPAGVGFNPANGYNTALTGAGAANSLYGQGLANISYGVNQALGGTGMPPWLTQWLIQNGLRRAA